MYASQDLNDLKNEIGRTSSIRGALFVLKEKFQGVNGCDVAYEYMMKDTSYVRGDLVSVTTLSSKFTDLYLPCGGPNSDPVLEHATADSRPFCVSLKKLFTEKNTKYSGNKFYGALLENGCDYFAASPFKDDVGIGFGVFTIFATAAHINTERPPEYFHDVGLQFHKILKAKGQLARHFDLQDKERFVLAKMADGKIAADIAQELGITVRSIEMRLQSARKKLHARTTTEAVYKATAYSILPYAR